MNRRFPYILRYTACVLAPVIFFGVYPHPWNGVASALVVGIAALIAAVIFWKRTPLAIPLIAFSGTPLLVVAAASALIHDRSLIAFSGAGFEVGTVGSFALCAIAFALPWFVHDSAWRVACVSSALLTAVIAAYQMITFVFEVGGSVLYPSHTLSLLVTGIVYSENLLQAFFGIGPNAYFIAWSSYISANLSVSPLWGSDVVSGASTALTLSTTLGSLGVAALVLIPTTIFLRLTEENRAREYGRTFFLMLSIAVFYFVSIVLYPIALPLFLVGAFACGYVIHALSDRGSMVIVSKNICTVIALALGLCLLIVGLLQLSAAIYHARAVGDDPMLPATTRSLDRAARLWPIPLYERAAANAFLSSAFTRARDEMKSNGSYDRDAFEKDIARAVAYAENIKRQYPRDYTAWTFRTSIYIALISVDFPEAKEKAREGIDMVTYLVPGRPEIPYMEALIADAEGDTESAIRFTEDALKIEPRYELARVLRERLGN